MLPVEAKTLVKDPRYKAFQPYGGGLQLFYDKGEEVLLCGPAGTGKSRTCLEKMHLCALKYPGMRGLMVRKTRESLTQSALVTYERFVLPDDGGVRFRTAEQQYEYRNGSTVVLGGMDKYSKVMSSEYDLVYVMEATELTLDDWESLVTRCRFGVMPYNQIIADCNPNSPFHWLKLRADSRLTHLIPSVHQDNPVLWNHKENKWTPKGEQYMAKLNKLTGVRLLRLTKGIWAAAEGMIYTEWNPSYHRVPHFDPPKEWRRVWAVDFGYTAPLVFQAWAINPDGVAYRFFELYHTKMLVEDVAATVTAWRRSMGEPLPEALVCDHDAEGRATLERHLGVMAQPADKRIGIGIQAMKGLLRLDEHNRSRMYFMYDSSWGVDPDLSDLHLPLCTEDEIEGYEWAKGRKNEEPIGINDHGMDATRYFSMYADEANNGWVRGMQ